MRGDPGKKVEMKITLKRGKEFKGEVTTQWIGLPRGVVCAPVAFDDKTKEREITVPIVIGPKSPPGRHRYFRLRVKVKTEHGTVVQDFRGGEIRIDRIPSKRTKS